MGHALVDSSLMWIRPSRPSRTDEGAEVDELRDRAVDDVADLEVRDRRLPRVGLEAADRGLIRPRSWLMSMTSASTSSPTL
jgi:hypothetical protein